MMENLKKVSRTQWCLFALFIGFAFLMQNCQDDDTLIYEENQTETELNAKPPVSGKVDVCRFNSRKGTYSVVSIIAKFVPSKLLPGDVIIDADGDGYAAPNECTMLNGLDCDDTNAAINPGAVEICGDNIDNNCDGVLDDGCTIEGKTFVPDDNFEQALINLGYDNVLDNYVDTANINSVITLNLSSKEIGNLTGIEDFAALEFLECWNNSLTRLDLSKNTNLLELFCQYNALTELIVSNSLVYIDCGINSLTQLDLSANVNLIGLACGSNKISELNLSNNNLLDDLKCSNNLLTSLDVSSNPELKYLNCSFNTGLGSLDVGSNPNLETLNCYNIGLTSLNLSGNLNLLNLYCDSNNQLIGIDVSKNIALKVLSLDICGLTSLDVTKNINLEFLSCGNNALESLNLSKNAKLTVLRCIDIGLSSLDLSGNPNLEILYCNSNEFISLDVSGKNALTELDCSDNLLFSLDISQNNALTVLDCSDNPNLSCIQVNSTQLASIPSGWWKDITASYSEDCGY